MSETPEEVIRDIQKSKELAVYSTFRTGIENEIKEISLKNQGSVVKYSQDSSLKKPLLVPSEIEYVCFKKPGYDKKLIPENIDESYLDLDGNVFLFPENQEYQPFNLNVNLNKNPLCIKASKGLLSFTLENKGSGIIEIR